MNEQNGLTTLPFDSTEDNRREITAAQRRRLYRDLWSDMVVRAFTFTSVGNGNFTVNGACLVNGAYADFSDTILSTAGVLANQTRVVARIVPDGQGGEDVGIRFVNAIGANDLLIGNATIVAGPVVSRISGARLSPIRIPDRTIAGEKLLPWTITSNELAADSVTEGAIADGAVTNAKIATNAVHGNRIQNGTIANAQVANNAGINWSKIASSLFTADYNCTIPAGQRAASVQLVGFSANTIVLGVFTRAATHGAFSAYNSTIYHNSNASVITNGTLEVYSIPGPVAQATTVTARAALFRPL